MLYYVSVTLRQTVTAGPADPPPPAADTEAAEEPGAAAEPELEEQEQEPACHEEQEPDQETESPLGSSWSVISNTVGERRRRAACRRRGLWNWSHWQDTYL